MLFFIDFVPNSHFRSFHPDILFYQGKNSFFPFPVLCQVSRTFTRHINQELFGQAALCQERPLVAYTERSIEWLLNFKTRPTSNAYILAIPDCGSSRTSLISPQYDMAENHKFNIRPQLLHFAPDSKETIS